MRRDPGERRLVARFGVNRQRGDEVAEGMVARERVEARLIERASTDPAFRERLLTDPKAAIGEELGTPVPEHVDVRVVEETGTTLYLVLPPAASGRELSEAELETIAGAGGDGGKDWSDTSWEFGNLHL
jgi:hypothetical protein